MNREIKFRAWDKETKEMSNDFLSKNWLKVCVESPYVELMQYTGLKDKNGLEIYEGDIVKVSPYQDEEHIVKVYHQYSALIIDTPFSSEHDWTPLGYYKEHFGEHTIEIIGNIYANPELLEAKYD